MIHASRGYWVTGIGEDLEQVDALGAKRGVGQREVPQVAYPVVVVGHGCN